MKTWGLIEAPIFDWNFHDVWNLPHVKTWGLIEAATSTGFASCFTMAFPT